MRLQSRIFITTQGCQDRAATQALMQKVRMPLEALYKVGTFVGYRTLVLVTDEDIDNYDVDSERILAETGGVLPALYLNLTFSLEGPPPDDVAVAPVLAEFGFRHLFTDSD